MTVTLETLTGADIHDHISNLARLRIEVFRSFPSLYDGDMDYEMKYLQTYSSSPRSLFVLAKDDQKVVGAVERSTDHPQRPADYGFYPFAADRQKLNDRRHEVKYDKHQGESSRTLHAVKTLNCKSVTNPDGKDFLE